MSRIITTRYHLQVNKISRIVISIIFLVKYYRYDVLKHCALVRTFVHLRWRMEIGFFLLFGNGNSFSNYRKRLEAEIIFTKFRKWKRNKNFPKMTANESENLSHFYPENPKYLIIWELVPEYVEKYQISLIFMPYINLLTLKFWLRMFACSYLTV